MFEGWGLGEVLFFTWIVGSVITGLIVTWGEKDNDVFYVEFMLCGIIWPLICIFWILAASRKKKKLKIDLKKYHETIHQGENAYAERKNIPHQ